MKYWIIEDEPLAAKRVARIVSEIRPEYEMSHQVDTIEGFLNSWDQLEHPDLLLMDIHLSDGLSLEVFRLADINTPVIFITAYDEHAIEAFRANAIDYLLKPIKKERLNDALTKLEEQDKRTNVQKNALKTLSSVLNKTSETRFLVKVGQKLKLLRVSEVAFFNTESKITFAHTKDGHRYPMDFSLEQLEDQLPDSKFFRINRQYIININAIDEMHAYSKSRVKVKLKPEAPSVTIVSTDRSRNFKDWLEGK